MKSIITSIFLVLTFTTQLLFAHGDHYQMTDADVVGVATEQVNQLVAQAKIPDSWKSASSTGSADKTIGGKKRWVVTFENAKETDAAKKKLEVVLTPGGKLVTHQFVK